MATSRKNTATTEAPDETGAAVLEESPAAEATPAEPDTVEVAAPEAEDAPAPKETEQQMKNRLRNEAEREVLNNHRDEFYKVAERKFKENGLEFTRRLTDEEKAKKKLEDLLAEHPGLRAQLAAAAPSE